MILSTFLYPPTSNSEPVHLDGGPGDTFFSKEGEYLGPLITLELDDLAHLFVLDEGAVAGEFLKRVSWVFSMTIWKDIRRGLIREARYLLECLQELLSVVLCRAKHQTCPSDRRMCREKNLPFGRPCNVVSVLRPFRCWIRIWM